jgi:chemotaxis protein CheZ
MPRRRAQPGADACAANGASASLHISHTEQQEEMLARVGHLTRTLHESLRGLGMDRVIERAAEGIPSTRERLAYVAAMTEQAAQRVLNATDAAMPMQDRIGAGASDLANGWQAALAAPFSESDYRMLAERTVGYLHEARADSHDTREQLTAIMMAQDFQDLTGQVIKKVMDLANDMEQQLLQLLVDYAPEQSPGAEPRRSSGERDDALPDSLMNGPQINPGSNPDALADQKQVDDLLANLGF